MAEPIDAAPQVKRVLGEQLFTLVVLEAEVVGLRAAAVAAREQIAALRAELASLRPAPPAPKKSATAKPE